MTNTVDAAIAQVDAFDVDSDGFILDIGVIDPVPAPAAIDMPVQKSGRTSGLTRGVVAAVDVSIAVGYSSGYGLFKKQVRIAAIPGQAFIRGGDSGSLLVTDPAEGILPQAVGLLFAGNGSGSDAFAFQVTDLIEGRREGPAVLDYLARRREISDYGQYLRLQRKIRRS